MVEGVIFDMDGLMFDTERLWDGYWKQACAEMGVPCKEGLTEAIRGSSGETLYKILRSYYGEDFDAEGMEKIGYAISDKASADPAPKKAGLDELMDWLDEHHIPMAVASGNKGYLVRQNLDNWNLIPRFKAVITGDMVPETKPSPAVFQLAAQKLGTQPEHTLVLEDSYNGIRAGAAGGFITVMVPDLCPVTDEMRQLYTAECKDLHEVCRLLNENKL